jgi:leishmanolysin-like peptidase
MELENQMSDDTYTVWEKRIFSDDFMTGNQYTADTGYSRVSFAVLEDTGWYTVNYEYATPMNFGKNRGCSFVNEE